MSNQSIENESSDATVAAASPAPTVVPGSTGNPMAAASGDERYKNKRQLADHFQCSVRSINNLMQNEILPFTKVGSIVRFEFLECDQAFEQFCSPSVLLGSVAKKGGLAKRTMPAVWKTKAQIAEYINVSSRTVTNMMLKKHLAYVKIGNVVRFDLGQCEQVMQAKRQGSLYDS